MPWLFAGVWNDWTDEATGEVFESNSMLTQNRDAHPLLNRVHKPEPDLPPDKGTVTPLEVDKVENVAQWFDRRCVEARSTAAGRLVRRAP